MGQIFLFPLRTKEVTWTLTEAEWICGKLYHANPIFILLTYPQAAQLPRARGWLKTHENKCSTIHSPIHRRCPVAAPLAIRLQTTQLESLC